MHQAYTMRLFFNIFRNTINKVKEVTQFKKHITYLKKKKITFKNYHHNLTDNLNSFVKFCNDPFTTLCVLSTDF